MHATAHIGELQSARDSSQIFAYYLTKDGPMLSGDRGDDIVLQDGEDSCNILCW